MPPKKRAEGVLKYKTGFCNDIGKPAQHEGTKPTDWKGQPMAVCTFWNTCPCECHAKITQMYELTGMDREPPEQPAEYLASIRADRSKFVMPSLYDSPVLDDLSMSGGTDTLPGDERAAAGRGDAVPGTLAASPQPRFAPTPTGRRARGQLEYDVLAVCKDYVDLVFDWDFCTPKNVSEEIGKRYSVEPPSTGAINAVWDRWEKLGFATQDKKPSRFVAFLKQGDVQTLDRLKAQVKREKKRSTAEARRGTLRPRGR